MQTPEYGLFDVYRYLRGSFVSAAQMGRAMLTEPAIQLVSLAKQFDVPMFLLSGLRDHFTLTDMADYYLRSVSAPNKKHIVFEDSGHYPNEDHPEAFITTLKSLVEPYLKRDI